MLTRLCVFAGRFTLDDVEQVCCFGDVPAASPLDLLSSLIDKATPAAPPWAYFVRGFLAVLQNDPVAARPALERAVTASRGARQLDTLSSSLAMASIAANMAGDRASTHEPRSPDG